MFTTNELIELIKFSNTKSMNLYIDSNTLTHMTPEELIEITDSPEPINGLMLLDLVYDENNTPIEVLVSSVEQRAYSVCYTIPFNQCKLCKLDIIVLVSLDQYIDACHYNQIK